jgi:hypothetical protein
VEKNSLWSDIQNQFNLVNYSWNSIISNTEIKNDTVNSLIEEIKNKTYQQPLFIYNQKAVSFVNQIHKQNQQWALNILRLFLQPDAINIHNQPSQIAIAFHVVMSMVTNEDNSTDETRQLNKRTIGLISDTTLKLKDLIKSFENQFEETNKSYLSMISENSDLSKKKIDEHNQKFEQIEKTYEEKVRIAKPAELWNTKMKEYKKRGYIWTGLSFANATIISIFCILFFIHFPEVFTNTNSQSINISAPIKWLILTGIGIGSFIYLLRLCVKLALSSFHMSRDAEEKCALTSFYLSLINEKKLDPEKENELKNIVMNSLFARVDTGLLKGDTSPTLPSSGLNEILRLISGR